MKKLIVPAVAGVSALALVGGIGIATAMQTHDVTLSVDGAVKTIAVREDTVAEVLELEGITVGQHDVVLPAKDTAVSDGLQISVEHAHPLNLSVDGKDRTVWTTARTVGDALAQLDLNHADSLLSTSRSTPIGREGLSLDVTTAKDVKITAAGKTTDVTIAGTVAEVLAKQGIKPDADDIVTPAASTALADGMQIKYVNVQVRNEQRDVKVPYEERTKKTDKLLKGEKEVKTKGAEGIRRETWAVTVHDGKPHAQKKTADKLVREPVDKVTLVGTKEKAKETADKKGKATETPQDKGSKSSKAPDNSNLSPAVGNTCKASYYWQPQPTASGERFNTWDFTAAHKTLPMGTRVKVTNKSNGKSTIVRINDRGPYVAGRCLDLSTAAMKAIGGTSAGVVTVTWQRVG